MNPVSAAYASVFGACEQAEPASRPAALRILACGAVDDGKSTLIGRLLFEAGAVPDDQLAALEADSRRYGAAGGQIDYALLTDGLEAERERNITIDVAYRYLSTPRRDFIIADTPGHEQYTANMATGASQCELGIILVDAGRGLQNQTFRHAAICSILGIRHVVLAVNKMDSVGFAEERLNRIADGFAPVAKHFDLDVAAIPISARLGDNVVTAGSSMPWYDGPSLLEHLERIEISRERDLSGLRLPIQGVLRTSEGERLYTGSIAAGTLAAGDAIRVAPSGRAATVQRLFGVGGPIERAHAGMAVALTLAPETDIGRGDLLHAATDTPALANQFSAHVVWFGGRPLLAGRDYEMRLGAFTSPVTVTAIRGRLDIVSGLRVAADEIERDEIAICHLATPGTIAFDNFAKCPATGGFLLIDRASGDTVAAGMIRNALDRGSNLHAQGLTVDRQAREGLLGQKGAVVWFTGLSGSGKSTIADALERKLHAQRKLTMLLDGDNVRLGLNRDLGFTEADRVENLRRAAEVARLMVDAGLIVLCSFISPFAADRAMVRERLAGTPFLEIFVDAPIEVCEQRDPKGLYAKARRGEIRNFTGIDSTYEIPADPDLHLDSSGDGADELAGRVMRLLAELGIAT
ncbi:MAG TPA: adenylyl-sulfate kinase [Bosea sp. (in: a-proteobacteria)]|uniref:adenylyl-sulfate kinase n=1 Tax=Bosea sp. (in: a-proteobacteria) TaxID=1871050 RepID=UPI002E0D59AA|nr:adenylyl-sulfate kinase [Bosea sp. (in: a-proteobacteria)]